MISSCPICNLRVLTAELERHANSHFKDDQLQRDMELARHIALADSNTDFTSGPERYEGSFIHHSTDPQGASSSHTAGGGGGGGRGGGYSSHHAEILDQQISCLVGTQVRSEVQQIQGGVMNLLKNCLDSEGGSSTSSTTLSIISGHIDHHQSLPSEDEGWGCGWRNIQIMSSHLLNQRPEARKVLFGGSGFVPDIPSLQRWLEIAWDKGFDTLGSTHFHNKVYGAKKWIGTTECATLFRSFGLRARIVDFDSTESSGRQTGNAKCAGSQVRGPMDKFVARSNPVKSASERCHEDADESMRGSQVLVHWVWNYFAAARSDTPGMHRVTFVSDKTPLYFQHQGHSRTIIGIQKKKGHHGAQDQYTLLILDPGHKTADLERSLRNKRGWQSLVKRGVHTLKKPQYQLCYVDPGIANAGELEQLKTIDSILAKRMDVVAGETSGVERQLLLLYPVLFILQRMFGILLLQTALHGRASDWQVVVCDILLVVMAVGNFVNTVETLILKLSKEQAGSPSSKLTKYHKLGEYDYSIRGKNNADTINFCILQSIKQFWLLVIFSSGNWSCDIESRTYICGVLLCTLLQSVKL